MKACKSCNNIQSLDCYHDEPRSKDGKKHQCKTCISSHLKTKYSLNIERMRERNKAWQEANPDKVFAKHLRLTYNLLFEDYIKMMGEQNGLCAICHKLNVSSSGEIKRLVVDHCHSSNKIRGLLCDPCNHMLGFARDCPAILQAGINYLNYLI